MSVLRILDVNIILTDGVSGLVGIASNGDKQWRVTKFQASVRIKHEEILFLMKKVGFKF